MKYTDEGLVNAALLLSDTSTTCNGSNHDAVLSFSFLISICIRFIYTDLEQKHGPFDVFCCLWMPLSALTVAAPRCAPREIKNNCTSPPSFSQTALQGKGHRDKKVKGGSVIKRGQVLGGWKHGGRWIGLGWFPSILSRAFLARRSLLARRLLYLLIIVHSRRFNWRTTASPGLLAPSLEAWLSGFSTWGPAPDFNIYWTCNGQFMMVYFDIIQNLEH